VLTSQAGHVSYLLLRGGSPQFADPNLTPVPAAQAALGQAVAALVAPNGGEAVNQSQLLARFDIGFVLMRAPLDSNLVSVLDGVPGLTGVSTTPQFDLWRLAVLPSRVSVLEPNGTVVPLASGQIGVPGSVVPAAGGTVLLAEPAGGWSASVNGHALTAVASPGSSWAQAFKLPPGGGTLTVSRAALLHDLVMALELLAIVVVAVLALPGIRTAAEMEVVAAGGDEAVPGGRSDDAGRAGSGRGRARPGERLPVFSGTGRPGGETTPTGTSSPRRSTAAVAADGPAYAGGPGPRAKADEQSPPERSGRSGGESGQSRRGKPTRGRKLGRGGGNGRLSIGRGATAARDGAVAGAGAASSAVGAAVGAVAGRRRRGQPDSQPTGRSYDESRRRGDPPYDDSPGFADEPRRRAMSPSGTFDEPYDARPRGRDGGERPTDGRSGSRYPDGADYSEPSSRRSSRGREPGSGDSTGYRGSPDTGRGDDSRRDYATGRGYESRPRHGGSPYQDEADYSGRDRYADERGPGRNTPPRHRGAGSGDGDFGRGRDREGGNSWGSSDQSAWPSSGQWSSADERRGWPEPDQQAWPDAGDALEGLPGEVHHDWPGREDRTARGWPAPGDGEEETW